MFHSNFTTIFTRIITTVMFNLQSPSWSKALECVELSVHIVEESKKPKPWEITFPRHKMYLSTTFRKMSDKCGTSSQYSINSRYAEQKVRHGEGEAKVSHCL
jgi:hypothetical protein